VFYNTLIVGFSITFFNIYKINIKKRKVIKLFVPWSTSNNLEKPNKYVFVVESDSQVVWYKYESNAYGSGQNYLYLGKKKFKLSEWLYQFDFHERKNEIEFMKNQIVNQNNN
jgi:hypothetical protein